MTNTLDTAGLDELESISGVEVTLASGIANQASASASASASQARGEITGQQRGALVGKFMILRKLGEGGMGQVYAAYDPELDRKVALKLLRPNHRGTTAVTRLLREAQGLARLSHRNVVHVFEIGQHEGSVYIAMEYIEGQTLREYLASERGRTQGWRQMLATLIQAGHGLAAAHEKNLVHRDFKPDNVMVAHDGIVRVLDFGLVRNVAADQALDDEQPGDSAVAQRAPVASPLTKTGAIMGTPAYMALEQLEGRRADALTDQFAFCMVTYEALYGMRPFDGETAAAVAARMYAGEIRPRPAKSEVPKHVHDALRRGLSADVHARWPDMQSLLAVLEASLEQRRRGWLWLALGASGALLLLLAVATPLVSKALFERDQTIASQEQDLAARAAELEQRNRELERQLDVQAGLTAALLAESPGHSFEALVLALDVYGRYLRAAGPMPHELESGMFAATRGLHDSRELIGHTERVTALAFSPDASRLATASRDDSVKLWDLDSGEPLRSFVGHVDDVRSVVFASDGARLLTTSSDATATVWLVDNGKVLATIDDYDVSAAVFAPDARTLAVAAEDGTLSVWSSAPGEEIVELHTMRASGRVAALEFSPDGARIVSATSEGRVQLWAAGHELAHFDASAPDVRNIAFSADATLLAAPGPEGRILLHDARSGALTRTLETGYGELWTLAFAPVGAQLLSTGSQAAPMLWQPDSGVMLGAVDGHREAAIDVAFSPDGLRFATISYDARLRIGDAASGRVLETLEGQLGAAERVSFSPDGARIVTFGNDSVVRVWSSTRINDQLLVRGRGRSVVALALAGDRSLALAGELRGHASVWATSGDAKGQLLRDLDHAGASVYGVAIAPDTRTLATGDTRGLVRLWDAESGTLLRTLEGHRSDVKALAFTPDGARIVSSDMHGLVRVWNVADGALLREWQAINTGVSALAISPDGSKLACAGLSGFVSVWSLEAGTREQLLSSEGTLLALAFSPDGTRLAVAGMRAQIEIWSLADARTEVVLDSEDPSVDSLAFSPDGLRLISGGDGVRLWELGSRQHLADFGAHEAKLIAVAFSADGKQVWSGSTDGQVQVSIADASERLRLACLAVRGTREYTAIERTCDGVNR